jgi:hypothetical protein
MGGSLSDELHINRDVLFTKCRFSGAKFFFVSLDREIASLKM